MKHWSITTLLQVYQHTKTAGLLLVMIAILIFLPNFFLLL